MGRRCTLVLVYAWYDGEEEDGTPIVHADEAWWKDAMEQSYVITRDEVPSME